MEFFDQEPKNKILEGKPLQMKDLVELEKILQNSSFAHAYAELELTQTKSKTQKELLLEKLDTYRQIYFQTREYLATHYPDRLEKIERDLISQKRTILTHYTA